MSDLKAELAYFRHAIAEKFAEMLAGDRPLPADAIRSTVEGGPFSLSPEDSERAIRELESSFSVLQERGAAVSQDLVPWLQARRGEIDFFYWDRLKSYQLDMGSLPPQVVATLDSVTDEVLDYCGNPAVQDPWRRRGMVMGHVQSGKTTNYSALICKAADVGYKIVILLAGITNSLRSQTQERLDESFIGRKSVFQSTIAEPLAIVQFATQKRFPAYGTSRDRDFRKDAAATYGVTLAALKEPIIFVTKKNKSTLELLRDWLRDQTHGGRIQDALLLIDDEADNASINTSKEPGKVTTINRAMREILELFNRSSYVGYTATPFANIFIDPETDESMLGDDLFPRHFVKALDPPSNYVGADRVFDEDGNLHRVMVRIVSDYQDILPLNHKKEILPAILPDTLRQAIRVFVLALAIRTLRGDGTKHCSMMINVSRFNNVQECVHGLVYEYLQELTNAAVAHAGLGPDALSDPIIRYFKGDFDDEFSETGVRFEDVLQVLVQALKSITAITVNMRGGSLDYSRHKEGGLHVIAIGGLALSRGLTLEGLTVSYILRNTAASDTLMQMARWFGYRPNYEDLCRVYLPKMSYDHYRHVNEAIEELRWEVKRMQQVGATPAEFGLRVRQSPTAIRITAANKMRSASSITVSQDYSGRHVEGHVLRNDQATNEDNLSRVAGFLKLLGTPKVRNGKKNLPAAGWRGIHGESVLRLIRGFQFPPQHPDLAHIDAISSLFADYVSDRLQNELERWDVAIPALRNGDDARETDPFGLRLKIRRRKRGRAANGVYRVYGSRNRIADPADARLFLTDTQIDAANASGARGDTRYCLQRSRPLLLVHIFRTGGKLAPVAEGDIPHERLCLSDPVVSLSFCLPRTSVEPVNRTYQVNAVYRRQLEALAAEEDDDDAYIEYGQDV
ncbi:MAG: Z1 domain-containing protein [Albidovulum sp.]|nr:Z1 domain-containing protein [Albidovulum sp.]